MLLLLLGVRGASRGERGGSEERRPFEGGFVRGRSSATVLQTRTSGGTCNNRQQCRNVKDLRAQFKFCNKQNLIL